MGRHNKFLSKLKKRGAATVNLRDRPNEANDLDKHLALKKEEFEDRRVNESK